MEWMLSSPMFAWMLPAAALPVVFHLAFRLRTRPAVISTLMFFDAIDPKLSARRRIHEWLVLLLRCLFLALLLGALARPVWMVVGAGRRAVVMVVDNSGSMGGPFREGVSRLQAATDAARALSGRLRGQDVAGVVLCVEDATVALPAEMSSDRSVVRAALDRIVETEASADPGAALQRAFAMLEEVTAASREVHILSDLQEGEWGQGAGGLPRPREGVGIFVHRIGAPSAAKGNLALAGFRMPAGRLLAGRTISVEARVSNPGSAVAEAMLHWSGDGGERGTVAVSVPAGGEKLVALPVRPEAPGERWVYAWLQGDGFAGDNRAGLAFACVGRVPVLLAGGASDFGLLPLALSPGGGALSGIDVAFAPAAELAGRMGSTKPALVAAVWSAVADHAADVQPFVAGGGNLLLVPSGAAEALPEWAGARALPPEGTEEGASVVVFQKGSELFADLRGGDGPLLSGVKAFRFRPLVASRDDEAVIGLEDGRALLVAHRQGGGHVFTSGLAFDAASSTLPLKAAFLAMAQRMALAAAAGASSSGIVAGERPRHGFEAAREVAVKSLAGSAFDWKGEGAAVPAFPRAGVYALRAGEESSCVGVRASEREGIGRYATGARVPALGALSHRVEALGEIDALVQVMEKERRGLDLSPYLLVAAMACLLAETWVANFRRSAARKGGDQAGHGRPAEAA